MASERKPFAWIETGITVLSVVAAVAVSRGQEGQIVKDTCTRMDKLEIRQVAIEDKLTAAIEKQSEAISDLKTAVAELRIELQYQKVNQVRR